jgi:hypothetical protein
MSKVLAGLPRVADAVPLPARGISSLTSTRTRAGGPVHGAHKLRYIPDLGQGAAYH